MNGLPNACPAGEGTPRPLRSLVINTACVGDVVFTMPLLESLGRAGHSVGFLCRPGHERLVRGLPGLSRVHLIDKRGTDAGVAGLLRVGAELRGQRYDLVIGAHPSVRSGLLAALSRAPLRVGWGPIGYHVRVNRGPRFVEDGLELAAAAGLPTPITTPRLRNVEPAPGTPEGAIGLVPGARWATKRWPAHHWADLAERLRGAGRPVVLIGSADERALGLGLGPVVDRFGGDLGRAASVLAACVAVVGGDSGLVHIARAVGTPALVLFGPTDAARHPQGAGFRAAAVRGLACRPCSAHGPRRCPRRHHRCMQDLAPARVFEVLQAMIGGSS